MRILLQDGVEFPCPSCGATCVAASEPEPCVLHRLPLCDYYASRDLVEILRDANAKLEAELEKTRC